MEMITQPNLSLLLLAVVIGLAAENVNAQTAKIVIGGAVGNGDFNADTSETDARQFQETDHWFNLAGSEAGPIATKNNATEAGLFQGDGTRHALLLNGPVLVNDTPHTVAAASEVFRIELDFCDAIPKWKDNTDAVEVFFFTSDVAVNGNTEAGDITEVTSTSFSKITKDGKFEAYSNTAAYTTTADDIGNKVFVGFRAKTEAGIGRIDNFVFAVGPRTAVPAAIVEVQTSTGDSKIIVGGAGGNGDFNSDTSDTDARQFQNTKHWHNLTGTEDGPTATKHNASEAELFKGDGTRHALVLNGPVFINDTGHIVSAAGETFHITLDFCDAIPKWNDNTDEIEVFFFTCEVLVNAHTETKDIKEFGSIAFSKITKDGKFEAYSNLDAYTTVAGNVGKEVFVGFRAKTEAGIGRVDNFVFEVANLARTTPQPLAAGPFGDILKNSPGDWELVSSHSDEFDGDTIDTNKWNIDPEDWGVWSWEPEYVSQKDGSLHLTIVQETHKRGDKELYYKSGMAKKEETITYGYFEARVRGCSRYPGACPAFWLYSRGPDNRYQAKDGEIVAYNEVDFIELQQSEYDFKRKRHFEVNHIDSNLHVVLIQNDQRIWFRPGTHPELCKTEYDAPWDPRDDYHIYAGEVSEDWIVLYIDGQEVGRKPNLYWHLPMHLAVSLGLRYPFSAYTKEGLNVPVPEQTTKEGFPTTMSVDYVRVWQKRGAADGDATVKRTWTDLTGKFTLRATFVGFKDGKVSLKRADGSITVLPLEKLSVDDQQLVRELVSKNDD